MQHYIEKSHIHKASETRRGTWQKMPKCSIPSCTLALAVPKERGGLILAAPQEHSYSRVWGVRSLEDILWGALGMGKYQAFLVWRILGMWDVVTERYNAQVQDYGRIRNSKHDFWHAVCLCDHWTLETGAGTLWKAIRAPIQSTGFASVQRKRLDEVASPGNFTLWLSPSVLHQKCIQWGLLPFITCVTLSLGEKK